METRTKLPDNAWAMSILSKGSRCGPGKAPARTACSTVIGSSSKFCPAIARPGRECRGPVPPRPGVCRSDVWWRFPKPTPRSPLLRCPQPRSPAAQVATGGCSQKATKRTHGCRAVVATLNYPPKLPIPLLATGQRNGRRVLSDPSWSRTAACPAFGRALSGPPAYRCGQ